MRRTKRFGIAVVLGSLTLAGTIGALAEGCRDRGGPEAETGPSAGTARSAPPHQPRGGGRVRAEMKGVDLRIDPQVVLEVRSLEGALVPAREGEPPWFDDPRTFAVEVDQGEIAVSPQSLAALLNHYVFTGPKAPVENVEIEIHDGKLRQSATLRKKVHGRTQVEGDVSVTAEGDLRLHPTSIKAGGVPVKGLLDLLDVELSEMIKAQEERGVKVVKDDFILDPERLLPSPRLRGRVTAVRLEPDRVVQVFGGGRRDAPLHPAFPKAEHYMFFRGGELSFGKLTMHGADLQIIDADPQDPFHFFLSQYLAQLVAGTSRTLPDKGLVVWMPDYDQTPPLGK
jgi:hypothetical protein